MKYWGMLLLATALFCSPVSAASLKATVSLAAAIESNEYLWMPDYRGIEPELTVEYDKQYVDILLWEADGSPSVVKYKGWEFKLIKETDGYSVKNNVEILAERIMKDKKTKFSGEEEPKPLSIGDFVQSDPLPRQLEFLTIDRELYGNKGRKFWRYKPKDAKEVNQRISIAADRLSITIEKEE